MNETDVNQQKPADGAVANNAWPDGDGSLRVEPTQDDDTLFVDLDGFEGGDTGERVATKGATYAT